MFYPWLLTIGALIVVYFAATGIASGEYGGKHYTVRRATERRAFWLRIGFALLAALGLLAVAWIPMQRQTLLLGLGAVLFGCGLFAAAWGETVVYRKRPIRRDASPVFFWLHVLSLLAAGVVMLAMPGVIAGKG